MAERADVTAAALVEVDVELARLYVEIVASDDVFAVALHWAQIDMMLDRRLTISARRTNAAEGEAAADPTSCVCGLINTRHCPVHGQDAEA